MSIHIETFGRLRAPLLKGAASALVAALLCGPLAAQTAAPIVDDPMEALLEPPQEARPLAAPIPAAPAPEPRFANRPAAPAAAAPAPAAPAAEPAVSGSGLGFSSEPTRIDAQSLGRAASESAARGDVIVQDAARRWGLSSATLYMLGALLGLLGLLLLARLLGFGQKPAKAAPRRKPVSRASARPARAQASLDDWEEPVQAEGFAQAARRAASEAASRGGARRSAAVARPVAPPVAPDEDWGEEWSERPEADDRGLRAARLDEASRRAAPRRPNLDRLAASIRETWPKGEAHDAGSLAAAASPARAAAARVAREFAQEEPDEIPPAPSRAASPTRRAPRGDLGGDFLDALEAAGDPSSPDRIRALTRAR